MRNHGLKLVNDEIVRTRLGGAIKGKQINRIDEAFDIVDEAYAWRGFFFSVFLAKQKHSQGFLFVKLFLSLLQIQIIWTIV